MRRLTIEKTITPRDSKSLNLFFTDIRNYEVMTHEEEYEIFEKYNNTKDEKLLEEIVHRNLKFVVSVAKQYITSQLALEDLTMSGCIGLIKAAERFDYTRGFKFSTFAVWYIRNEVILYIINQSRNVRIPSHISLEIRKIQKKIEANEELTEEELIKYSKYQETQSIMSLDKVTDEYDPLSSIENSNADNPLLELNLIDKNIVLNRVLHQLGDREQLIIEHLFGLNGKKVASIEEVAIMINCSSELVRQIKNRSLYKMKRLLKGKAKDMYFSLVS